MSVAIIYRLAIERFRCITSLSWHPAKGVNLILGGGDVGKTTILDAIGLLFSPTNPTTLADTDYHGRDIDAGFVIEAIVSLPPESGINQQTNYADCSTLTNIGDPNVQGIANGQAVAGQAAINLQTACNNNADPYRPFYGLTTIQSLENKASSNYNALQFSARKSVGAVNLTAAYTYSHSIDDTSDRYDGGFVDSYNLRRSRASSNFDQRHLLTVAWIYDLPFFKKSGPAHTVLGGWQYSGIETFATGTPVTVYNGTGYGDNAGVGNGVGSHSYADLIGNPGTGIPGTSQLAGTDYSKFVYNPGAYALPTGLTFGDSGRNSLRNVHLVNFDMALFKHFAVKENMAFEFRADAFNVFNHTDWGSYSGTMSCTGGANKSAGDPSCVTPGGANMFEMSSALGSCAATRRQVHFLNQHPELRTRARKRPGFIRLRAIQRFKGDGR